ncbi:neurotrypsin-like [Pecten maximus]|uniref:neurotrypsin-like n=1 Tax=Pecten maximus TaxID=6579 RepID=UPI001457F5ED|nr:neurotrypsin-like [Pecten maximus]
MVVLVLYSLQVINVVYFDSSTKKKTKKKTCLTTVNCYFLIHISFDRNGAPFKKNHFGTGTEPIFVDDLNCSQSDFGIHSLQLGHTLCFFKGWNVSDCDHGDAGVLCSGDHGRVRLVNGITPNEGRVEIYHDEEWGTICDDNFDEAEAHAVCEALGYRYGTPFGKAHFGRGRGHIFVDELECSAPDNVTHLLHLGQTVCSFKGWGVSNCNHREDAGVKCDHARVRLVNSNKQHEGRVEIYHEGQWGTICDDNFRKDEARAVCDELGYSYGIPFGKSHFGRGTGPIFLNDLNCSESDPATHLLHLGQTQCFFNDWNVSNCTHEQDAGVRCQAEQAQVRLSNGGRVEIYHNGRWGTICGDNFHKGEATAICEALGYRYGIPLDRALFEKGTESIFVDKLDCSESGPGTHLLQLGKTLCSFNGWEVSNCNHYTPVRCENAQVAVDIPLQNMPRN